MKLHKKRTYTEAWWFVVPSIVILFVTTVSWSLQSAVVQAQNADQLVNAYLFESWDTFKGAVFPGQHSFLLKWPLFWLMRAMGNTPHTFELTTVLLALITVGGLAYILYKIDQRPYVFGTYLLVLSSILLLVPAQPYAGGILPVNFAMVTTRNIEYLFYCAGLVLLLRSRRIWSRDFIGGTALLILLFASDKLFITLGIGGALLGLLIYGVIRRQKKALLPLFNWLLGSVIATIGATIIIAVINQVGLTHIMSSNGAGPYGLITSAHQGALGAIFAVLCSLTNFGANPMYDAAVFRVMPHLFLSRIFSLAGPAYIVNMAATFVAFFMSAKVLLYKKDQHQVPKATLFAWALLLSSAVAVAAFIATNHYYVVDARYVSIELFAVLVAAAVYLRSKLLQLGTVYGWVIIMVLVAIMCGRYSAIGTFNNQLNGLQSNTTRNALVAHTLASHKVDALVGDYWRVLPIKQLTHGQQKVTPLDACGTDRQVLSSSNWKTNLNSQSFAYLQTLDKSLTNYDNCDLREAIHLYGQPNSSKLIAGTPENPKELLLFYDKGAQHSSPLVFTDQYTSTLLPVLLSQIPDADCQGKPRILNIVAHQDDDLLFINPDLTKSIRAKECVRSIYVTAGDAGTGNKDYWHGRERGTEAAYSKILSNNDLWAQYTVKLKEGSFVTLASPQSNLKVAFIFMHLPDGNIHGDGFKRGHPDSLASLEAGRVNQLQTVDTFSTYTYDQLTNSLVSLMQQYKPTEIRSLAPYNGHGVTAPDHSDHMAVGRLTQHAVAQYAPTEPVSVKYYQGYQIKLLQPNVTGQDLKDKVDQFLEYGKFDPAVCHSAIECFSLKSYGSFLQRQYTSP